MLRRLLFAHSVYCHMCELNKILYTPSRPRAKIILIKQGWLNVPHKRKDIWACPNCNKETLEQAKKEYRPQIPMVQ